MADERTTDQVGNEQDGGTSMAKSGNSPAQTATSAPADTPQQQPVTLPPTTKISGNPILIGSIIHLQNQFQDPKNGSTDGGYLGILKKLTDAPLIQMYHDPNVRAFVATHKDKIRSDGSGAWQIISADGAKQIGEQLVIGDRIHLLNIRPDAGYLDSFEWVERMVFVDTPSKQFFENYPMQIGVFTSTVERGEDVSGTWIIHAAAGKKRGDQMTEDDVVELENAYPGAGFLHSYDEVSKHPLFKDNSTYQKQRLFVFTGPKPPNWIPTASPLASKRWKITLWEGKQLYRVSNRRNKESTVLIDGGTFLMGGGRNRSIDSLTICSTDQGKTLSGTIKFKDVALPTANNFIAKHSERNFYTVTIADQTKTLEWRLGWRELQRVVKMDITFDAGEATFAGTMIYTGEDEINVEGRRDIAMGSEDLVSQPGWIKGRTNRVERAINEIDTLLTATQKTMNETPTNGFDMLDYAFQLAQLSNLAALSRLLNSFFRYRLHALMTQSIAHHKQAKDGTVAPFHLFRACFQQVALDQAIIQQAIAQRQWRVEVTADMAEGKAKEQSYTSEWAAELLELDKLAIKAMMPFQKLLADGAGGENSLAVITYLSEKTHIHLVPYTKQFILIGVSYDHEPPAASIFADKDFIGQDFYAYEIMAIPHEVGHYVYQHGKLDGKTFFEMSEKLADNPYYRWCEEIFADVYSCIVAGPLAAISMQTLLMSIDRERAWKDDEEHPTPVLRVFIFAEILRILNDIQTKLGEADPKKVINANRYDFLTVTDKLDQDWAEILKLWRYDPMGTSNENGKRPERVYMHDNSARHRNTIVNVNRVMKAIQPIIREFATCLLEKADFGDNSEVDTNKLSMKIPWTKEKSTETKPYNDVMARMGDSDFARKQVSYQALLTTKTDETQFDLSNPDEKLQSYLKNWGERGPFGSGTGTYSIFYGAGLL